MLRSTLSVLAGLFISWILVFIMFALIAVVAPNAFPDPEVFPPELWVANMILAFGFLIAVISGYVTALIARHDPFKHGLALAGLTIVMGVISSVIQTDVYPLWCAIAQPTVGVIGILIGARIREIQIARSTGSAAD